MEKNTIKLSDLSQSAVLVNAIGTTKLIEGEIYLVGIPSICINGKLIPVGKRMSLIPDLLDDIKGDNLVIIKRAK